MTNVALYTDQNTGKNALYELLSKNFPRVYESVLRSVALALKIMRPESLIRDILKLF